MHGWASGWGESVMGSMKWRDVTRFRQRDVGARPIDGRGLTLACPYHVVTAAARLLSRTINRFFYEEPQSLGTELQRLG